MELLTVNIKKGGYLTQKDIIKDINFIISEGEIVGLIGQNGAGKSTTIKAIIGTIKEVIGDIHFAKGKNRYAYIPEQPIYYEQMTLWEHLELASIVFNLDNEYFIPKGNELLEIFRMQDYKHHLPGSFSKGMQQKLMIILAFLINPDVYIVDEPFVGLDPRAIKDFLKLIDVEKKLGKGMLISTHLLDTAEKICDRLILIDNGTIITQGKMNEIKKQYKLNCPTLLDCFNEILGEIKC